MTTTIRVHRDILQGDSLSLLLFNLIINTLINTIKYDKIECMGYFHQNFLKSKQWFQFADDTTVATSFESDNQYLVMFFSNRLPGLI